MEPSRWSYHLNKPFKPFLKGWLKTISLLGAVLLIAISFNVQLKDANAGTTQGVFVYSGSEDTPAFRQINTNGTTWGGEQSAQGTAKDTINQKGPFLWVVVKVAPSWITSIDPSRAGEKVMVCLDTQGRLVAQVYSNGVWGAEQTLLGTGQSESNPQMTDGDLNTGSDYVRGTYRPFDIAYSSNLAVVVALNPNTPATGSSNLLYWRYNGNTTNGNTPGWVDTSGAPQSFGDNSNNTIRYLRMRAARFFKAVLTWYWQS